MAAPCWAWRVHVPMGDLGQAQRQKPTLMTPGASLSPLMPAGPENRGVGAAGGHRELLETIFSPGPAAEEALGRCSLGPRWFRQELRTCFPDSWPQHFYFFFPPETSLFNFWKFRSYQSDFLNGKANPEHGGKRFQWHLGP